MAHSQPSPTGRRAGIRDSARAYRKISVDDLVWIYAGGVHQFICALGRVIHTYQDRGGDWHVVFVWDTEATAALERQPIHRSAFGQIPQSPQRANPVTRGTSTDG